MRIQMAMLVAGDNRSQDQKIRAWKIRGLEHCPPINLVDCDMMKVPVLWSIEDMMAKILTNSD